MKNRLELFIVLPIIIGVHVVYLLLTAEKNNLPIMYTFFQEVINSGIFFIVTYVFSEVIHQKEQTGYSGLFVGLYLLIIKKSRIGIWVTGLLIAIYDLITGYIPIIDMLSIIKFFFEGTEVD